MDKKKSLLRVKLLQSKNIKIETKNDIKKDDKILQRDKEDQEIKNMFNEQNKEEHQNTTRSLFLSLFYLLSFTSIVTLQTIALIAPPLT